MLVLLKVSQISESMYVHVLYTSYTVVWKIFDLYAFFNGVVFL